ncbi:hypothetical protein HY333_01640 [Candidatus Collierbacteria bacterium]|nr:hypothetical protein [Candidatus Collierbacteria bacterium]
MSILFYDHLVDKREVLIYIDNLSVPDHHKGKLKQLVDDILHQGLVEFILQKLHPHQHDNFLSHLHQAPYDPEILKFLRDHTKTDIEEELTREAAKLIKIIRKDLTAP